MARGPDDRDGSRRKDRVESLGGHPAAKFRGRNEPCRRPVVTGVITHGNYVLRLIYREVNREVRLDWVWSRPEPRIRWSSLASALPADLTSFRRSSSGPSSSPSLPPSRPHRRPAQPCLPSRSLIAVS